MPDIGGTHLGHLLLVISISGVFINTPLCFFYFVLFRSFRFVFRLRQLTGAGLALHIFLRDRSRRRQGFLDVLLNDFLNQRRRLKIIYIILFLTGKKRIRDNSGQVRNSTRLGNYLAKFCVFNVLFKIVI